MADEKKCCGCNKEVKDEELDFVAGGKYTEEEWAKMTVAERQQAKKDSAILISKKRSSECKYVN